MDTASLIPSLQPKPPFAPQGAGVSQARAVGKAAALLLVGWLTLIILALQPRPDAEIVAAIFPPWWTAAQAFTAAAAAGADVIRPGAVSTILILHLTVRDGTARLQRAGAWFTADPIALGGCLGRANDVHKR